MLRISSGLADLALVAQKTELTRSQEKAITRYTHSNQDNSEGNLVLLNTDFKKIVTKGHISQEILASLWEEAAYENKPQN